MSKRLKGMVPMVVPTEFRHFIREESAKHDLSMAEFLRRITKKKKDDFNDEPPAKFNFRL